MKFALVSNVLPPSGTAHASIIYGLLSNLDPSTYCLLSSRDYTTVLSPNYSRKLEGKYYYLPPLLKRLRNKDFLLPRPVERITAGLGVVLRGRAIAKILRREKCDAVVVCTGGNEIVDFPAAYLASRLVGARFYGYLLDQYSHMVSFVLGKSFLRLFEPMIMKGAAAVIAPNEYLQHEVRRRYGVEAVVIHNACDLSVYEKSRRTPGGRAARNDDEIRIVYTGGIGAVHYDALRNLVAAIHLLVGRNIQLGRKARLHLYTAQPPAVCKDEGIDGPVTYHEHEPVSAMPAIQRQADILFLPLAFESPYPDIVKTAAPGKMAEFLASGRPILVHAPADSFIAWYFRHYECGLVVDQNDPAQLAEALELLSTDTALGERLSQRGWERAQADFSLPMARAQFAQVLGLLDN